MPPDLSIANVALCAAVGFVVSIIGGLAGYGTGLLMPLVLVPIIGPEPVVPIIGVMALFTNSGRIVAFHEHIEWRKVWRIALPGASGGRLATSFYDWLSGRGVLLLLGLSLLAMIPLRRLPSSRASIWANADCPPSACSLDCSSAAPAAPTLCRSRPHGDGHGRRRGDRDRRRRFAGLGAVKSASFAAWGTLTLPTALFAAIIGCATFPGGYVAKMLIERMSLKVHAMLLDSAVALGATGLLWRAWRG